MWQCGFEFLLSDILVVFFFQCAVLRHHLTILLCSSSLLFISHLQVGVLIKFKHQCHMWVVHSLLLVLAFAPRGFSSGTLVFPSPQKPTLSNSDSNQEW